jgi:Tfp pilus assembly protein PilZ
MLKARELPRPDEEITLDFQLLPSPYDYHLKAVVVWVAPKTDTDSPRGMGVRFVDLSSQDERQIEDYIEKCYPARP